MMYTNGFEQVFLTILSSSRITGISCGTTASRYLTGQVSRASARIVWFVYPHISRTMEIASSLRIPFSVRRRISSGMIMVGWVSLIWIAAYSARSCKSEPFSWHSSRISWAALLTMKYS